MTVIYRRRMRNEQPIPDGLGGIVHLDDTISVARGRGDQEGRNDGDGAEGGGRRSLQKIPPISTDSVWAEVNG